MGIVTSLVAWSLPGLGFWFVASGWERPFSTGAGGIRLRGVLELGGLVLAPGGVLVAGARLLDALQAAGLGGAAAAVTVFGIRLATVGVATALGMVFLLVHVRTPPAAGAEHFDDIADAYDVQIPESRRAALLVKKTEMMRDVIGRVLPSAKRGLDVGLRSGRVRRADAGAGIRVDGIDASAGQIALAARNVGEPGLIARRIGARDPEPPGSYDFLYTINVLHHLASVDEQQRAFAELMRVLKPGGLLFVHEINTRNVLFRFYMGYVFPSLNCIDEGVERWLLPHRLAMYTDAPLVERAVLHVPAGFRAAGDRAAAGAARTAARASPLASYSAHYMAVLRKR